VSKRNTDFRESCLFALLAMLVLELFASFLFSGFNEREVWGERHIFIS
jgi:hypothetical protein